MSILENQFRLEAIKRGGQQEINTKFQLQELLKQLAVSQKAFLDKYICLISSLQTLHSYEILGLVMASTKSGLEWGQIKNQIEGKISDYNLQDTITNHPEFYTELENIFKDLLELNRLRSLN